MTLLCTFDRTFIMPEYGCIHVTMESLAQIKEEVDEEKTRAAYQHKSTDRKVSISGN